MAALRCLTKLSSGLFTRRVLLLSTAAAAKVILFKMYIDECCRNRLGETLIYVIFHQSVQQATANGQTEETTPLLTEC